jgi:hypothetical protein
MSDATLPPKPPRHLEVVPKAMKEKEPDLLRPLRRWWKSRDIDGTPESVTLPAAMHDVGVLALAHIARRLADPKTPTKVKDQMAMVMGPKLGIQLVARGSGGRERAAEPNAGHGVLDIYRKG